MKKTFKLIDLDCANCAAKMETAIKNPGPGWNQLGRPGGRRSIDRPVAPLHQVVQPGHPVPEGAHSTISQSLPPMSFTFCLSRSGRSGSCGGSPPPAGG